MTEKSKFLILGGGISGLTAAYSLLKKVADPSNISIVESSSRLGGWIESKRHADGAVFEHGPRGLRPAGPNGRASLKMAYDLGLKDEVIAVSSDHVSAQNRYIYAHNKMHKVPSGIKALFKPQSLFKTPLLPTLLKEPFVSQKKTNDDESVYEFIERRLNSEIADYLIDPMCRGIFAGDIRKLSLKSCLPMLYNLEKDSGSIVKGMLFAKRVKDVESSNLLIEKASKEKWSLWSFKKGLTTLVEALENNLMNSGVKILKNSCLKSIEFGSEKIISATLADKDEVLFADHLISAIPSHKLAEILPIEHELLGQYLRKIHAVTVAVVNLEYDGSVLDVEGFGYLYPSLESKKILGVIFDSCTFPEGDRRSSKSTRLTVMLGGNNFEEQFGKPDLVNHDEIKQEATTSLREALDFRSEPSKISVTIQKDCIPQYYRGHGDLIEKIRNYIDKEEKLPLTLVGSWYDGVGINDCIYHTQIAVNKLFSI